jgi:hypothetical protein
MSRGTVFAPAVFCGTIPSNFNAGLNCWESLPPSCESQHPPPRTVFAVGVRRYRSLRRSRLCFVRLAAESAGFPNVALRCSTKTIVRLPTERREYANMEPQQAEPESPAELLAACLQSVRAQLPEGWELREMRESGPAYDAELELTAPDGATAFFAVQTKMSMERRDVGQVLDRASSLTRSTTATAMVISTRERVNIVHRRHWQHSDSNQQPIGLHRRSRARPRPVAKPSRPPARHTKGDSGFPTCAQPRRLRSRLACERTDG